MGSQLVICSQLDEHSFDGAIQTDILLTQVLLLLLIIIIIRRRRRRRRMIIIIIIMTATKKAYTKIVKKCFLNVAVFSVLFANECC